MGANAAAVGSNIFERVGRENTRNAPAHSTKTTCSIALVFRLHDRTTHVMAALRTNNVSRQGRAALRTKRQLTCRHGIMSATLAGAGIRMFTFRYSHSSRPTDDRPSGEIARWTLKKGGESGNSPNRQSYAYRRILSTGVIR